MDPFDELPPAPAPEPKPPLKPRKLSGTRKVTYAAAAAAIGTLCSVIAIYLPVKIMPLVVSAFCFFVVFERCGWGYGFLTEAVTLLMTFFVGGVAVNATFVILAIVFVPYAPVAYCMRKLRYNKVRSAALRGVIVAAFVNLAFLCVYFIVKSVVLGGGFDLMRIVNAVGGYWVIALILIPLAVSVDFLFTQMSNLIDKMLK